MDGLRTTLLMTATISTGLVAGVFVLYAHTIMPGLGKTDDRTFVGAFQAIDRAIINPWFLGGGFFGALLFTLLAPAHPHRPECPALDRGRAAAGDPDVIDVAEVRARFGEAASRSAVRILCRTLRLEVGVVRLLRRRSLDTLRGF
ncbi:hypothetical protein OHA25_07590 [Nonomuraea sp. NBC_00507]|uniref:hypothetical protein n=1 Tax=Nonomuraea sp. NBC_00507 TaxID=2976002 RepID=UPI002E19B69E